MVRAGAGTNLDQVLRARRGLARLCVAAACLAIAGCGDAPSGGPLDVKLVFGETGRDPGQFSYPRGMDAGGGHLWVVDKQARVQRIDPTTGEGLGEFQMPEWDLGKPTGVTAWIDGDGVEWVFVADTHYHRIMVYRAVEGNPAAVFVGSFGGYGEDEGQFIYPTDIAVRPSDDGRSIAKLYVSEYGGNDRISIWEPALPLAQATPAAPPFRCIGAFGAMGISMKPGVVEFRRPQSIALDVARGRMIVADACNHRLGVLTETGELVRWIGDGGEMDLADSARPAERSSMFSYPYGLALLDDGTVLVSEYGASHVRHVDPETGRSLGVYGRRGRGEGELATPWAIAVIDRTAYVLDSGNNRVIGFDRPDLIRRRIAEGNR